MSFIKIEFSVRLEIFVGEDRQLRVAHLILDYEPLSRVFQDLCQAIRANDPRLAGIDVSVPRFLTRKDLPLVELPLQRVPRELAASRVETAFSRLSLEVEIDQFRLEEEGEVPDRPVELSDCETKSDRFFVTYSLRLVVAQLTLVLKKRKGWT